MMSLLQYSNNVVTYVDLKYIRIKISTKQQQNKKLENNEREKRTAETLIANTPSGYLTPMMFLLFSFLCCCCGDFLNKNSTPKFLSHN